MELLQLRYFCVVAEFLNISKAAAFKRIPQSAMSSTISKLEKELGKKLFSRESNKIRLTPDGIHLYNNVKPALEILDRSIESLHSDNSKVNPISVSLLTDSILVSSLVREFASLNCDIVFFDNDTANSDIVISAEPIAHLGQPDIVKSHSIMPAVNIGNELAAMENIELKSLCGQRLILSPLASKTHSAIILMLEESGIGLNPIIYCISIEQCMDLAEKNLGITFIADTKETNANIRLIPFKRINPSIYTYIYITAKGHASGHREQLLGSLQTVAGVLQAS